MSDKGNDPTILAFDLVVKLPAGPQSEELVTAATAAPGLVQRLQSS